VGSHAGISDTSQVLFVYPAGIRPTRLAPRGGGPDSGVSGDPTKATAEIGRMGLSLKINAAIRQYRRLKDPSPRTSRLRSQAYLSLYAITRGHDTKVGRGVQRVAPLRR